MNNNEVLESRIKNGENSFSIKEKIDSSDFDLIKVNNKYLPGLAFSGLIYFGISGFIYKYILLSVIGTSMIMGCIYFLIILVIYVILGAISIEYCRNQNSIWPICKNKILTLREESWKRIRARELVVGDRIKLESTGPSNLMVIPADLKIDYMPSTMMIVVEEALIGYSITKDKKGLMSMKSMKPSNNNYTKPYEEDVLYAGTYATIIGPEYIECHVIAVGNNTVAHSIMYDYFKFEETTMP